MFLIRLNSFFFFSISFFGFDFGGLLIHSEFFFIQIELNLLFCFFLKDGRAPIHMATWGGYQDIIQILLKKGADLNAVDKVCISLFDPFH